MARPAVFDRTTWDNVVTEIAPAEVGLPGAEPRSSPLTDGQRIRRRRGTPEQRFHASYERVPGGCWVWQLALDRDGYGRFRVGERKVFAHRFAYELLGEPIPSGLQIDHLCRNKACVNSAHLEPVTLEENLRRSGKHVITPEEVREIRRVVDDLCAKYGIGPEAISRIGRRRTWKSLPD